MRGILVVLTTWSRSKGPKIGDVVLPGAIPLDREDPVLPEVIRSFRAARSAEVPVVVMVRTTAQDLEADAARKIGRIVDTVDPGGCVRLFSHAQLRRLWEALEKAGRPQAKTLVNFRSAPAVANTALMVGQLIGVQAVVLYGPSLKGPPDPAAADRAMGWLGSTVDGRRCLAVAAPRRPPEGMVAAPKPFFPGGVLAVHRDLLVRLPFDPAATLHPEEDYVLDALSFGYEVIPDSGLSGGEAAPEPAIDTAEALEARYRRYALMRGKLRVQRDLVGMRRIPVEELDPYPGEFLREDLEKKFAGEAEALAAKLRGMGAMKDAEAGKCEALRGRLLAGERTGTETGTRNEERGTTEHSSFLTPPSSTGGEGDSLDAYLKVQRQWVELQETAAGMKVTAEELFA